MAIGLPTGIYLTGELCGGDGNFWLTGLGVVAGSEGRPESVTPSRAGRASPDLEVELSAARAVHSVEDDRSACSGRWR